MQFTKLQDCFEERDQQILLRTPKAWHRKRGLVLLFLLPVLAVLCGGLCGGGLYDESGQGSGDALFILVLVGIPSALLAAGGALMGAVRLIRASSLAERSEVRIDLQGRRLVSKQDGELAFDQISGLELVQPSMMLKWRAIQAKVITAGDAKNPYQASSVKTFTLLKDIEPVNGPEALALMELIGQRIGKPVHATPEMSQSPSPMGLMSGDRTAVTCHVPVQAIWLIFSLINLKNSNPLVRYHARLSLLLGGMYVLVLLGLAVLMGLLGAVIGDVGMGIGGLLVALGLFTMLGLRIVGLYKAWKKEYWQPPFFKSWTSSWLPEDPK